MDNSLLSTIHIRSGDQAFNLLANESGEPITLENAIHKVSWPDICAAFPMDSVQTCYQSSPLKIMQLELLFALS